MCLVNMSFDMFDACEQLKFGRYLCAYIARNSRNKQQGSYQFAIQITL